MKTRFSLPNYLSVTLLIALVACTGKKASTESSSEVEREVAADWVDLFDGQTLRGWKRYNAESIGPLWRAEDGMIINESTAEARASEYGGSLITVAEFSNFELKVDFRLSAGGNSGILYHVVESDTLRHAYDTGPEYQLLDDAAELYADLKEEQYTASSYDMYAAPVTKKLNPVGEWNTARIIYNRGHVEYYLNGELTVSFDEESDDWATKYSLSKWTEFPAWNLSKTGAIALQDHGAATWFRNIKIREL